MNSKFIRLTSGWTIVVLLLAALLLATAAQSLAADPPLATAPPPTVDDALLGTDKPDAAALEKIVQKLGERNATVREAAVSRLAPHVDAAAAAVVEAFAGGKLNARLGALELLTLWHAPVAELDPWRPETCTAERLAALKRWSAAPGAASAAPTPFDAHEAAGELDRLLKIPASDVAVLLERLARYGAPLKAEVRARLQRAETDEQRQRLTALRYRLVADGTLALRWPGGLSRLAAPESHVRHQAVQELAALATTTDEPLLLELFADADPLVREMSLRALQRVAGSDAADSLFKLLADPEPNVRAAVLKQLAEKPPAAIVPKLTEYLKNEKDADLVVHGVRLLREIGTPAAVASLVGLTRHESWQVRAEAVEAIGKVAEKGPSRQASPEVSAAVIALLDDPDAFVVSRALKALNGNGMPPAEKLMDLAKKHPTLAVEVVKLFGRGGSNDRLRLRILLANPDAAVRAAAITQLCSVGFDDQSDKDLTLALGDKAESVRIAAATGFAQTLQAAIPKERLMIAENAQIAAGNVPTGPEKASPVPPRAEEKKTEPAEERKVEPIEEKKTEPVGPSEKKTTEQPAAAPSPMPQAKAPAASPAQIFFRGLSELLGGRPSEPAAAPEAPETPLIVNSDPYFYDTWLANHTRGATLPKWVAEIAERLDVMLAAESPAERAAAAIALLALGYRERAPAELLKAVQAQPNLFAQASESLAWLPWPQREKMFQDLLPLAGPSQEFSQLVFGLSAAKDPRAQALLWRRLEKDSIKSEAFGAIYYGLDRLMRTGDDDDYRIREAQRLAEKPGIVKSLQTRLADGPEPQKLAALVLLAEFDNREAALTAVKLVDDEKASRTFRDQAFQILLSALPQREAQSRALAALAGEASPAERQLAVGYLALGGASMERLQGYSIYLRTNNESHTSYSSGGELPIMRPEVPAGLKAEVVRPLLADKDPKVAAEAGYLLCLVGERDGLEPLVRQWRSAGERSNRGEWTVLVYKAIAMLNDPGQIPILQEIYDGYKGDQYDLRMFYWTVRIMTGPEALAFRAKIRKEVGIDQLR